MFLRFVNFRQVESMQAKEGIFRVAGDLVERNDVDQSTINRTETLLVWFADNLEAPEKFNKTKSKGYYRKNTKGLSWFKPTAIEHINRAFQLKMVLDENGYPIEVIKSSRLGYILYEDEYQIIAEPFSDTRVA